MRNRLRTANFYHLEILSSIDFGEDSAESIVSLSATFIANWKSRFVGRPLLTPCTERIELGLQLFQLLPCFAELPLCSETLVVFQIFRGPFDEGVKVF